MSLITSPQVPTVTASDHQRVTPTTKALALSTFAPTVTTPSPQLVTPTTAALVATKYAPVVGTRYYAAVQATGPLAWWRLGEPSGTVSDDEIGSANADYVNTPTLGVASLLSGDTNTSVTFSRASLEHTSANTNMPAGSSAGFSAKGWVRFATVTAATRYPIVRWFGGTGAPDTQLYYNVAVGAWRYLYQDATGFRNTHSDAWSPSTATTYFIVVTHDYSAETVKFYVNGTLLSTEDVSVNGVPVVHAAGSSASVGRAASDYWDGTLDEVALYNGVLTPTQILALYNAGSGAAGPAARHPGHRFADHHQVPADGYDAADVHADDSEPRSDQIRANGAPADPGNAHDEGAHRHPLRADGTAPPARHTGKSDPDGYQVRPDGHNAHSGGTGYQGTRPNTVCAGCHCRKRAIGYPDDCRNPADEVRAGSQRDRSPGGYPPSGHADSYEVCPNGQRHGARGCHPGCQIADSRAAGAHRRPHRPCRGDRAQGDADDHPLCAFARADKRRSRHPDHQEPDALGTHPDRHGHGQRRVCPNDEGRDHRQVCANESERRSWQRLPPRH